ncbi:MAG: carbon monoxide dehydrogenase subunit G [Candidatus Eremiobacteraeota bacterium]|nr:carbon monoxide dehydrogenase subunit G [Candidatus Eremiobacteraeota bacterium]
MNLEYGGRERIDADRDTVWAFVNDPAKIAGCMPDVLESHVVDEHTFDAVVQVAVGPVRGKFKFHVVLVPQPGGEHMDLKISGGGFGSVVDLNAGADVSVQDGATVLDWKGVATMRGPLAAVGGRVIDAQAKRVITTTFANVKTQLGATALDTA